MSSRSLLYGGEERKKKLSRGKRVGKKGTRRRGVVAGGFGKEIEGRGKKKKKGTKENQRY